MILSANNKIQHSWSLSYQEAVVLQEKLRSKVEIRKLHFERIQYLASADVSFNRKSPFLFSAVLVFSFPDLKLLEKKQAKTRALFPYIPGLLSFREAPALIPLFQQLKLKPDLILVDGQGIAHPREFGLASHLGVLLGISTIGCAKTKLVGDFAEIPKIKGNWSPLLYRGREIGRVLCTRSNVKPIFISVGHRINLDSAVQIVNRTVSRYRIPDPIREAHILVNKMRIRKAVGV